MQRIPGFLGLRTRYWLCEIGTMPQIPDCSGRSVSHKSQESVPRFRLLALKAANSRLRFPLSLPNHYTNNHTLKIKQTTTGMAVS